MKFATTPNMTDLEKTNVWWANQIQIKNAEIERLQEQILAMTYKINFDNLTIENDESNGVKAISDITGPSVRSGEFHVQYVNDDGRLWVQRISFGQFLLLELHVVEAPYTASDYGMEPTL